MSRGEPRRAFLERGAAGCRCLAEDVPSLQCDPRFQKAFARRRRANMGGHGGSPLRAYFSRRFPNAYQITFQIPFAAALAPWASTLGDDLAPLAAPTAPVLTTLPEAAPAAAMPPTAAPAPFAAAVAMGAEPFLISFPAKRIAPAWTLSAAHNRARALRTVTRIFSRNVNLRLNFWPGWVGLMWRKPSRCLAFS